MNSDIHLALICTINFFLLKSVCYNADILLMNTRIMVFLMLEKPGRHNCIHRSCASRPNSFTGQEITRPLFNIFIQYLYNICVNTCSTHKK